MPNKLTGSTANFVTASSPVSFKQTFPSGILKFGEHKTRNIGSYLTIFLSERSLPVPAAIHITKLLVAHIRYSSLTFMCALVMAMVGRMSTMYSSI